MAVVAVVLVVVMVLLLVVVVVGVVVVAVAVVVVVVLSLQLLASDGSFSLQMCEPNQTSGRQKLNHSGSTTKR